MDKEKSSKRRSIIDGLISEVKAGADRRKKDKGALFADISIFLVAFFFARTHILFGSYPLAAALVAVLPSRVWIAVLGAAAGALSLGGVGIIHAIIALIILFLRIIISGSGGTHSEKTEEVKPLFCEPLIMRLAAAAIGAFVGAGYEMLLSGFSFSSVLFGVFGVGLTLGFGLMYSGLFFANVSVRQFLFGERNLFGKREGREELGIAFFQASFAVSAFLLAYSLEEYTYFGISVSYIFIFVLTLFIAKRFGAVRGMAIGFISSVGVSPALSVAFALSGVGAGILFNFGLGYAIAGAGLLAIGWSGYVSGMQGLLSVLPEYLIAATILSPVLKRLPLEKGEEECESISKKSEEMVGALWLADKEKISSLSLLEESLGAASDKIRAFSASDGLADFEEYRKIVINAFSEVIAAPCEETVNKIATKLYKKQKLSTKDTEESGVDGEVFEQIFSLVADYERSLYEKRRVEALGEEYELISKMINESKITEQRERALDETLSAAAKDVFIRFGFPDGDIRVFGDRKKRVIGAGLDADGRLITSKDFKEALSEALGVTLGEYEYFRRGEMAMFKCAAVSAYTVRYAVSSLAGSPFEVSGDSSKFFTTGAAFFSIISDGMGSGKEAKEGSDFVTGYLSDLLISDVGIGTAMSALNHILRHKGKECTATLDLFRLDTVTGDALFIKSGAAPSYVKRDKSIFRIRSETAPVGLIKSIDAERVRIEVKSGDYIIMLSDGVSASVEDSPWLLSYLTKAPPESVEEYAEAILSLAKEKSKSRDDMTVCVLQILSKS